jgi:formate dehydrogenase iron-sulfur subunit
MASGKEKGLLIDITRCMGCRGCQVACKQWNRLAAERFRFNPDLTGPSGLSPLTWTQVRFSEAASTPARPGWDFVKRQCLHCVEPACVAVCPVGAFVRTSAGPVVHNEKKCMGCRYCMLACPMEIPKFEWEKTGAVVRKCTLCHDRLSAGLPTACAQTCPTGATKFGARKALLAEAEARLKDRPDRYVRKIYGKNEVGGTAVLYLSDVPFERLGFRTDLGNLPLPTLTWNWLAKVPAIALVTAAGMAGLWWFTGRRVAVTKKEAETKDKGEDDDA